MKFSRHLKPGMLVGTWGGWICAHDSSYMRQPPLGVYQAATYQMYLTEDGSTGEMGAPRRIVTWGETTARFLT